MSNFSYSKTIGINLKLNGLGYHRPHTFIDNKKNGCLFKGNHFFCSQLFQLFVHIYYSLFIILQQRSV